MAGILNKTGTYTIAMAAKAYSKPLYAMAQSLKYMENCPTEQDDVPASSTVCQTLSRCFRYCSVWILRLILIFLDAVPAAINVCQKLFCGILTLSNFTQDLLAFAHFKVIRVFEKENPKEVYVGPFLCILTLALAPRGTVLHRTPKSSAISVDFSVRCLRI